MKAAGIVRPKIPLTIERLREVINYDPETGGMWRGNKLVGSDNHQGYLIVSIDGRRYRAHRLAWFYVTSEWPEHQIDHINGKRGDNRWLNLREVTTAENTHNQRKPHRSGSTGFLGVRRLSSRTGRPYFIAKIGINGHQKYLGTFDTAEKAHAAYVAAKRILHSTCTI